MPRSARTETRTLEPAGVWISALRTRLWATWVRRSGSPSTTTSLPRPHRQCVLVGERVVVLDHVGADAVEADRFGPEGSATIELRQQEEILDQPSHALGLLLDPLESLAGAGLVGEPAPAEQLRVATDGGERGAELVGGIRHELAQPVLGGRFLGEGASRSG